LAQSSDHDSDDWIKTDKNPPGDQLQDALEGMIERAGGVVDTEQKANPEIWSVSSSMSGEWFSIELDHLSEAVQSAFKT
jgi:hypothetical protein